MTTVQNRVPSSNVRNELKYEPKDIVLKPTQDVQQKPQQPARKYSRFLYHEYSNAYSTFSISKRDQDVQRIHECRIVSLVDSVSRVCDEEHENITNFQSLTKILLEASFQKYRTSGLAIKMGLLDYLASNIFLQSSSGKEIMAKILPQSFVFPVATANSCECGFEAITGFNNCCLSKEKKYPNGEMNGTMCACKAKKCVICYAAGYLRDIILQITLIFASIQSKTKNQKENSTNAEFVKTLNEELIAMFDDLLANACQYVCKSCSGSVCISAVIESDKTSKRIENFISYMFSANTIQTNQLQQFNNTYEFCASPGGTTIAIDPSLMNQYTDDLSIAQQKLESLQADYNEVKKECEKLLAVNATLERLIRVHESSEQRSQQSSDRFEKVAQVIASTSTRTNLILEQEQALRIKLTEAFGEMLEESRRKRTYDVMQAPPKRPIGEIPMFKPGEPRPPEYKGRHINVSDRRCGICREIGHNKRSKCKVKQVLFLIPGAKAEISPYWNDSSKKHLLSKAVEKWTATNDFHTNWRANFPELPEPSFSDDGITMDYVNGNNEGVSEETIMSGCTMTEINCLN